MLISAVYGYYCLHICRYSNLHPPSYNIHKYVCSLDGSEYFLPSLSLHPLPPQLIRSGLRIKPPHPILKVWIRPRIREPFTRLLLAQDSVPLDLLRPVCELADIVHVLTSLTRATGPRLTHGGVCLEKGRECCGGRMVRQQFTEDVG